MQFNGDDDSVKIRVVEDKEKEKKRSWSLQANDKFFSI